MPPGKLQWFVSSGRLRLKEALLIACNEELSSRPAAYFRRKAAHTRQVADEVTTRAVKLRLLDEAIHYDELAAEADRTVEEAAGF